MYTKISYRKDNLVAKDTKEQTFGGLTVREVGHSKTPPGIKVGPCLRDCYILHYLISGKGTYLGQPIKEGDGFLICPDEMSGFVSSEENPFEHYWIMFYGANAVKTLASAGIPTKNHVFSFSFIKELVPVFENCLESPHENSCFSLYLLGALFQILSFHAKGIAKEPQDVKEIYLDKAVGFLRTNYHTELTVNDIAAAANISAKYLYKLFLSQYGMSPHRYLNEVRMERAKELLLRGGLSISQVATSCGYPDPLYFSKVFRRVAGVAPREFITFNSNQSFNQLF